MTYREKIEELTREVGALYNEARKLNVPASWAERAVLDYACRSLKTAATALIDLGEKLSPERAQIEVSQ